MLREIAEIKIELITRWIKASAETWRKWTGCLRGEMEGKEEDWHRQDPGDGARQLKCPARLMPKAVADELYLASG